MADLYFLGGNPGTASNWFGGSLPTNSDTVTIDARMTNALTGTNQATITLSRLDIFGQSNDIGSASSSWRIGTSVLNINRRRADGSVSDGPNTTAIDTGTVAVTATVFAGRTQGSTGLEPVLLAGVNTANVLVCLGGRVGLGTMSPGQASTYGTVSAQGSSAVNLGSATTVSLAEVDDNASVNVRGTLTRGNVRGGTLEIENGTAVSTVSASGGVVRVRSRISGDELTHFVVDSPTTLDISDDIRGVSVGTLTLNSTLTVRTATDATQFTWGTLVVGGASGRPVGITFTRT